MLMLIASALPHAIPPSAQPKNWVWSLISSAAKCVLENLENLENLLHTIIVSKSALGPVPPVIASALPHAIPPRAQPKNWVWSLITSAAKSVLECLEIQQPLQLIQRPLQQIQRPLQLIQRPLQQIQRPLQLIQQPLQQIQRPLQLIHPLLPSPMILPLQIRKTMVLLRKLAPATASPHPFL